MSTLFRSNAHYRQDGVNFLFKYSHLQKKAGKNPPFLFFFQKNGLV